MKIFKETNLENGYKLVLTMLFGLELGWEAECKDIFHELNFRIQWSTWQFHSED